MSLVCNPGAFWLRRAIWLVIIICLMVWLCLQLKVCVDRLSAGGTVRAWSRRNLVDIPVPAVTVCHGNVFKKSVVLRHQLDGFNWQAWRQQGYRTLNWSTFDGLDNFYRAAAYSWADMVLICTVDGRPCSEIGTFRTSHTLLNGLCTTLNTNVTVGRRMVGGQITLVMREREQLDDFEHSGWTVFLHTQEVHYNDFAFFSGQAVTLKVYGNRMHQMKIFRKITQALPHGSGRGCNASDNSYTGQVRCLGSCLMKMVTAKVVKETSGGGKPCSVPWIAANRYRPGTRSCRSLKELERSAGGSERGVKERDFILWTDSCPCTASCRQDRYHIEQHEKWHVEETSVYLKYPGARAITVGGVDLWISDVEESVTEREAYSFDTFIAEVGGNLGLMLGGSLLTFVEILDCVVASCVSRQRKRAEQRG
ncbi:degenerin mec-4-like [Pollicipes pollicipes]|uniref:degenerin mec-4-like n=1 Tax=Pollicipes pollicipes TaxID=41117 RepID=UPI00188573F0|nr:degenerin mec-4-like [Pollicipes pollicipes]